MLMGVSSVVQEPVRLQWLMFSSKRILRMPVEDRPIKH